MGRVQAWLAALAILSLASAGAASAQAERPLNLVVLGDSLTAGYGLPGNAAFPAQLERALKERGHAVTIQNAGVSGDTASGGLSRLGWSAPDGTDAVIVALGANDALRGIDPKLTRAALDEIIQRLRARNIPVLLVGMYAPRNLGPDYVRAFDVIFPELAKKHGVALYPFFLEGVVGERSMNLADGVHPNAQGVAVMVKGILPTLEEFLGRLRKA